jgi:Terminase RNaseH-like domain
MKQIVGLDLGQSNDFTALVVLEVEAGPPAALHVVHLERIRQQPYPVIVARVLEVVRALGKRGPVDLVVDNTGVGRAVVDLLEVANPVRVNIHGGQVVTGDRRTFGVPKKDLVASVVTAFEGGTLKIAHGLELGPVLAQEALRLEARIKTNGHVELAADWRERDHDDLVLALACGLWWALRPSQTIPVYRSRQQA